MIINFLSLKINSRNIENNERNDWYWFTSIFNVNLKIHIKHCKRTEYDNSCLDERFKSPRRWPTYQLNEAQESAARFELNIFTKMLNFERRTTNQNGDRDTRTDLLADIAKGKLFIFTLAPWWINRFEADGSVFSLLKLSADYSISRASITRWPTFLLFTGQSACKSHSTTDAHLLCNVIAWGGKLGPRDGFTFIRDEYFTSPYR